jgi:hypothetical protein
MCCSQIQPHCDTVRANLVREPTKNLASAASAIHDMVATTQLQRGYDPAQLRLCESVEQAQFL